MRFPAFAARRGGAKSTTWWGKVWLRTVEETAYDDADVAAGWRLARAGAVGAIQVDAGRLLAAVRTGPPRGTRPVGAPVVDVDELVACTVAVDVLDAADRAALVEVVAAESGRVAALLAGDLPTVLVEHAEEAGVSLLPEELDCSCTCGAWVQPCAHVLAVLAQTTWIFDADPLVLFALRGLPRDLLLASLAPAVHPADADEVEVDLDVAEEAVARAAGLLADLD